MARAEGGLVPSVVGYGEGCPLFSRLGGLGERHELPQRGPGRILAYFEGHRSLIFVLIWQNLRGTICIIVPLLQILGGRVSPVPPWSTPMQTVNEAEITRVWWFKQRKTATRAWYLLERVEHVVRHVVVYHRRRDDHLTEVLVVSPQCLVCTLVRPTVQTTDHTVTVIVSK